MQNSKIFSNNSTPFVVASVIVFTVTSNLGANTNGNIFYNQFAGHVSDGAQVEGVGWFRVGEPLGRFCMKIGEAVCEGQFPTSEALVIDGVFTCTDGTDGVFIVTRKPVGHYVTPTQGSAVLSDGRSGKALFGPLQKGAFKTPCDAPKGDGIV